MSDLLFCFFFFRSFRFVVEKLANERQIFLFFWTPLKIVPHYRISLLNDSHVFVVPIENGRTVSFSSTLDWCCKCLSSLSVVFSAAAMCSCEGNMSFGFCFSLSLSNRTVTNPQKNIKISSCQCEKPSFLIISVSYRATQTFFLSCFKVLFAAILRW